MRTADFYTGFGASFFAHPFRAREASLWDSLYVGSATDGFGRFISTEVQHALSCLLPWLALPLLACTVLGTVAIVWRRADRLETVALTTAVLVLGALVRYSLELPFWSATKGIFLLAVTLALALAFERGRQALVRRGGRFVRLLLDLALVLFLVVSAATFLYR